MSTERQKRAARIAFENPGKPTGAVMLEAGYSKATSVNPKDLTTSKGWAELMDEYYPDSELLDVHRGGLRAMRTIAAQVIIKSDDPSVRQKTANARDVDFIDVDDWPTRWMYLHGAYKLKNKYPAEKREEKHEVSITLKDLFDARRNKSGT